MKWKTFFQRSHVTFCPQITAWITLLEELLSTELPQYQNGTRNNYWVMNGAKETGMYSYRNFLCLKILSLSLILQNLNEIRCQKFLGLFTRALVGNFVLKTLM